MNQEQTSRRFCYRCGSAINTQARFCPSCGSTVTQSEQGDDPLIGQLVAGQFLIQSVVGLGGMGRVYRAEQASLGRTVAIKVIHPHLLSDEQSVARFYTEARATSRLNHPNSVSVIDFGRIDNGMLYLVMEYLEGRDLGHVIEEEGPLPLSQILDLADGVLAALDEAHALGVIHRDLKPENIILKQLRDGGQLVKVVDFGLAMVIGLYKTSITQPGLICGTPDYMSPEQGKGESVDGRGDLYSLGVVLFELLTDRLPFVAETATKLMLQHIHDPTPDPREVAPHRNIPPLFAEVVLRAMAKDREDRYQSAQGMRVALKEVRLQLRRDAQAQRDLHCHACGALLEGDSRFCKACGTPVHISSLHSKMPGKRSGKPSFPELATELPILGRETVIHHFQDMCLDYGASLRWLRMSGTAGVGKSRLLRELCRIAKEHDDWVVVATMHPSGVSVPYHPMLTWCAGLLGYAPSELSRPGMLQGLTPLQNAGLHEMLNAKGQGRVDLGSRAAAVAEFIAECIRRAAQRLKTGTRLVLMLDDSHRYDGLTRQVIECLPSVVTGMPLVIVEALESAAVTGPHHPSIQFVELSPLSTKDLSKTLPEVGVELGASQQLAKEVLPLLLEQLIALRVPITGPNIAKYKVSDAVAQRMERLEVNALRLLQAIAVLGDACQRTTLTEIVDAKTLSVLDTLVDQHWVVLQDDAIALTHPWVRDIIEASIPAQARKQLHDKAMQTAEAQEALEIRAEHAWRGTDGTTAMLLLERLGLRALDRGDAETAATAFRRGLEIARRELLEHGDESLDTTIVGFSLRLGKAMLYAGEGSTAEGVLREVMGLIGPSSSDRQKIYLLLAENYFKRDRFADAIRNVMSILELEPSRTMPMVQAEAWAVLARSRAALGDTAEALDAYKHATAILESPGGSILRAAQLAIELGEWFADNGNTEQATNQFNKGKHYAEREQAHVLLAMAEGGQGTIEELQHHTEAAAAHYRLAAHHASLAGDAEAARRWEQAVQAMLRGSLRNVQVRAQ